ncbi:hypothetical protein FQA39_LY01181 [Lamprigera yunnana]|nr:hypothetical protein FQA39_LY01181 [Lamprigera yunnana]
MDRVFSGNGNYKITIVDGKENINESVELLGMYGIMTEMVGNLDKRGQLVDSIARTRDAGYRPYMAPERIDPQRAKGYDVRSDVWSLGITLMEVATGYFP